MKVDESSGLLDLAEQRRCTFFNERPDPDDISLLVVHAISLPPGQFGGDFIDDFFAGVLDRDAHPYFAHIAGMEVSAHLLIRREGQLLQYVPFHKRAWHAGVSEYQGRSACNDFSIGIELEGSDDCQYEPVQYDALAAVTAELIRVYPKLTPERIVGHSDIAPGRKTDPGPCFDWRYYRSLLSDYVKNHNPTESKRERV